MNIRLNLIICFSVVLSACAFFPKKDEAQSIEPACTDRIAERLYFGAAMPKGEVDDKKWENFLQGYITMRFPGGLTIINASGQWLGTDQKIIKERSRIVEIVHRDTQQDRKNIIEITSEYKTRFQQEAVLELRQKVTMCL